MLEAMSSALALATAGSGEDITGTDDDASDDLLEAMNDAHQWVAEELKARTS